MTIWSFGYWQGPWLYIICLTHAPLLVYLRNLLLPPLSPREVYRQGTERSEGLSPGIEIWSLTLEPQWESSDLTRDTQGVWHTARNRLQSLQLYFSLYQVNTFPGNPSASQT